MAPGDRCRLATDEGAEYLVELTGVKPQEAEGRIIEKLPPRPDPPLVLSLGVPLIKSERFETVLEKGTELGAAAFHPLALARCEVKIPAGKIEERTRRWDRICREAAKQCDRVPPPRVRPPASLDDFLRETQGADLKLLFWLEGERRTLGDVLGKAPRAEKPIRCALLFGPEGDLAPEEAEAARGAGFLPVSLGPRTLRADTAPIAALAALQAIRGDMACASS